MRSIRRRLMRNQWLPTAAWCLIFVCLGCDNARNNKVANQGNATRATNGPAGASAVAASAGKYGTYAYGMLPSDIPDDFRTTIAEMLAETEDVETAFDQVLSQQRRANDWLDKSLEDPTDYPILTADGSLPGPSTRELGKALQPLFDAFAADYEKNSPSPPGEKKEAIDRFQKVVMDVQLSFEPDAEAIRDIAAKFEAGDVDPIVLYPLLQYGSLRDNLRHQCLQSVGASLKLRPCSSLTKLMLVASAATKSNWMTFQDRARCAEVAIDSVEDVLREHGTVGPQLDYVLRNVGAALNPAGHIDYLAVILALDDEVVPEYLRHYLIAAIHEKVAGRARGGGFISSVSADDMRIFSDSSGNEYRHLLKAWTLNPTHPAFPKSLLDNEMRSGSTPLSSEQWYRLAVSTQADSRYTTKLMTRALQPRWGGSMTSLSSYTSQLIELAKKPDTRLLFDIPFDTYFNEVSWSANLASESGFDEAIVSLLESWEKTHGDEPDPRVTEKYVKQIVRTLWDAGDMVRLEEFTQRYMSQIATDNWYEYLIPVWLVNEAIMSRKELPDEAWDVLQRELLVGPERFDEARKARIEKALATARALVAKQTAEAQQEAAAESKSDTGDDAETSDDEDNGDEETWAAAALVSYERLFKKLRKFHDGETVDLIDNEMAWCNTSGGTVEYNADSIDIKVSCRNKNLLFYQPLRFPPPIVIELDVAQKVCDADPYGVALFAGPVAPNSTASRFSGRSLRYSPGYPMVMQDRLPAEYLKGSNYLEQRLLPVPPKATLRIELWNGGTRSYINDNLISETDYPINTGGYVHFGRRAGDTFTGVPSKSATYKVTSLRIKKFDPKAGK